MKSVVVDGEEVKFEGDVPADPSQMYGLLMDALSEQSRVIVSFVVDGKGLKMSKSLGNVILPEEILKKYGADILRIWVAASNYADDTKKNSWLCKIGKWRCPYIDAYDYYSLKDKEGNQVASSFKKVEMEKIKVKGQKIVKEKYEGCPRHAGSDEYIDIFS